ncbi:neuropeptide SIFamide [Sitodiplosis mosellana]|uniref:neuropeptide SIFamide n=1 Tax=Sitodiplosis mosellana TaxID=263140 RepID=UPI002443ABCC|nr:neuropeptide SIFamide [Sitodiplosis mosellana]
MIFATRSVTSMVILMTVCILLTVTQLTEAGYRKPPFNGSIFGKRSGNSIDYDASGKAISALCELALETCQSWLPQDKK